MDAPKATAVYAVMAHDTFAENSWCIGVYRDKAAATARLQDVKRRRPPGGFVSYELDEVDFFEAAP